MTPKDRLLKLAAKDPYQFPSAWRVPGGTSSRSEKKRRELDMWRQWKETNEDPKHFTLLNCNLYLRQRFDVGPPLDRLNTREFIMLKDLEITIRIRAQDPHPFVASALQPIPVTFSP